MKKFYNLVKIIIGAAALGFSFKHAWSYFEFYKTVFHVDIYFDSVLIFIAGLLLLIEGIIQILKKT